MKEYIEKIIATGLANGLTLDQIASDPQAAAKAYLDSELKAIDDAGKKLIKKYTNL
jgi:hypothetical protein